MFQYDEPWDSQPPAGIRSESENDWVLLHSAANIFNRKYSFEPVGAGVINVRQSGLCFAPSGSTNDGWRTKENFDAISGAATLTVVAEFVARTTTTGTIFGRWGATANLGGMIVTFDSGGVAFIVSPGPGAATWRGQRSTAITAGKKHRFVGVWRGGSVMEIYLDGVACPSSVWFSGSPAAIQTVSEKLYFCRHADAASGDTGSGVAVSLAGIKLSAISSQEAVSLSENPWQLFDPQPLYIPVAAAGGATFNPSWACGSNAILTAGVI